MDLIRNHPRFQLTRALCLPAGPSGEMEMGWLASTAALFLRAPGLTGAAELAEPGRDNPGSCILKQMEIRTGCNLWRGRSLGESDSPLIAFLRPFICGGKCRENLGPGTSGVWGLAGWSFLPPSLGKEGERAAAVAAVGLMKGRV